MNVLKKILPKVLILSILLITWNSCSRETLESGNFTNQEETSSNTKNLDDPNANIPVPPNNDDQVITNAVLNFGQLNGVDFPNLSYQQQTLIGQNIISNSLNLLRNNYGYTNQQIIDAFGSLDNPSIGALGVIITAYNAYELLPNTSSSTPCDQTSKLVTCLLKAAIPCTIMQEAMDALDGKSNGVSRDQAIAMGKELADLIIGIATPYGTALMVYRFVECMVTQHSINCNHLVNNTGLNESLELLTSTVYYYTAYHSHIGRYNGSSEHYVPFPSTQVFYNPTNQRYYMDISLQKLLPDGYYVPSTHFGSNNLWKFVQVSNGKPILVALANNTDPFRCLEHFYPSTHLPFLNN
ncbi:hypothetical protein M8998_09410 [Sphingobacterium sp. lm-10]|uniref:hypothetical protein n=1 Tax=Sphingobacterium sp. lm-10 TaxID=2944904 RepID=UPI0020204E07|nr:hypothetical protein [Sphingobacterium sp. lm-10]MCL7988152.1 hypothetical protein [Sphingobacterium sp. lm-10]